MTAASTKLIPARVQDITLAIFGTGPLGNVSASAAGGVVTFPSGYLISFATGGGRARVAQFQQGVDVPASNNDEVYAVVAGGEITAIEAAASTPAGSQRLGTATGTPVDTFAQDAPTGGKADLVFDSGAIHGNVAAEISAVALKAAPAGADLVLIEDSAAANAKKRTTAQAIADLPDPYSPRILSATPKSATFTAVIGEAHLIDLSGGNFTANLPALAGGQGKITFIVETTGGQLTIDGDAAETIGGKLTLKVNTGTTTIENDGTEWQVTQRTGKNPFRLDPAQITADQDPYNPADWNAVVTHLYVDSDASRNIDGFEEDDFVEMDEVVIVNDGSFDLVIRHDVSTVAANRVLVDGGADFTLAPGKAAHLLRDGTANRWRLHALNAPAGGGALDLLYVRDEKASGVDAGTFTSGAFQTRVLNTVVVNQITGASLAANQVTLPNGTYRLRARAPGAKCNRHRMKLRNITDGADELLGGSGHFPAALNASNAELQGRFTVSGGPKVFELQHRCQTTVSTDGFGQSAAFGEVEVYAEVWIEKE